MVQLLKEYREPTTSERFGRAFSNLGQAASTEIPEMLLQRQEDKRLSDLIGEDVSAIRDPALKRILLQNRLDQQQMGSSAMAKQLGSLNQYKAGLATIKEMRSIGEKGNLGRWDPIARLGSALGIGSAGEDRAKYEQLGKSLISLASTIPIRNQQEFQTLAEKLYDPSLPDSQRKGVLDAMENIIKRSMGMEDFEEESQQDFAETKKPKRSLESFFE